MINVHFTFWICLLLRTEVYYVHSGCGILSPKMNKIVLACQSIFYQEATNGLLRATSPTTFSLNGMTSQNFYLLSKNGDLVHYWRSSRPNYVGFCYTNNSKKGIFFYEQGLSKWGSYITFENVIGNRTPFWNIFIVGSFRYLLLVALALILRWCRKTRLKMDMLLSMLSLHHFIILQS